MRYEKQEISRQNTQIREDRPILNETLKNMLTIYIVSSTFIYTGFLIGYVSCVNCYMRCFNAPNIIIYLQCDMAGGYNSGGQRLVRLWDRAMAYRTHPLPIHPPKC